MVDKFWNFGLETPALLFGWFEMDCRSHGCADSLALVRSTMADCNDLDFEPIESAQLSRDVGPGLHHSL